VWTNGQGDYTEHLTKRILYPENARQLMFFESKNDFSFLNKFSKEKKSH